MASKQSKHDPAREAGAVVAAGLAGAAGDERRALAEAAQCLALADDAAALAEVRGGVEAMITDQLAAAHGVAMRLAGRTASRVDKAVRTRFSELDAESYDAQAARSALSAARMMTAFQRGALALDRLQNGGRMTITVQRVEVADGGQAVVAGNVGPGLRRGR